MTFPLLSLLIWLPIVGAGLLLAMRHEDAEQAAKNAKQASLFISLVVFGLSLFLLNGFDSHAAFNFSEDSAWIPAIGARDALGVDGLSMPFILLTTLLIPLCFAVSWRSITKRVQTFCASLLLLEGLVIGVFSALDGLLFYLFFESVLLPMYLLIVIWGVERRV